MHMQRLEPRSMMAVVGLDTSFGTNGRVTLDSSGSFETTVAAPDGGLFVEATTSKGRALYKYDVRGRIVTSFGTNGRAILPQDIDRLAYDSRTGAIYASGSVSSSDFSRQNAYVMRITPGGKLDTSFGEKGLAIYSPRRATRQTTSTVSIAKLLPQPDGGVVAALSETTNETTAIYNDDGLNRVRLLRLTKTGAPSVDFGAGGAATVYTGRLTARGSEFGSGVADRDVYEIKDVQARDDGSFRVIATETFTSTFTSAHAYAFGVASRVVTAAGGIDRSQQGAWQIVSSKASAETNQFRALYVAAVGDDGAIVVGDGYKLKARVYRLAADGSQRLSSFTTDGTFVNQIIATPQGQYFAVGYTFVVKLNSDFSIDRTWGDSGQGSFTENGGPSSGSVDDQYIVDASGRVLRTYSTQISRLNGTPPKNNTRLGTGGIFNGVLDILGTAGDDSIVVDTDTIKRVVNVTINGVTTAFDPRLIKSIAVDSGAGRDDLLVTRTVIPTGIFAGRGNDRVISGGETAGKLAIDLGEGDDRAVLSANELPKYVAGGAGYDTLRATLTADLVLRDFEQLSRIR